jgi:hypothetical protein
LHGAVAVGGTGIGGSAAGTRNGPSHEGENPSKDFEQDGLQTRHQRPGKEERSPSCSISRLSILCHFEGDEIFSFADSDVLTLVCATRVTYCKLPARALGRTAYKRNTSGSAERVPVCMDLIQFFAKNLLLVEVLMCTYPAEICAGRN